MRVWMHFFSFLSLPPFLQCGYAVCMGRKPSPLPSSLRNLELSYFEGKKENQHLNHHEQYAK